MMASGQFYVTLNLYDFQGVEMSETQRPTKETQNSALTKVAAWHRSCCQRLGRAIAATRRQLPPWPAWVLKLGRRADAWVPHTIEDSPLAEHWNDRSFGNQYLCS